MSKVEEYLQHAQECRNMARVASHSHKAQLEEMARTWEQLASARQRKLEKEGRTDEDDAAAG